MISPCDGCLMIFSHRITKITAKEFFPKFCHVPISEADTCNHSECKYSIEGECCAEFQFCDKCIKDKKLIKKLFNQFADGLFPGEE